jgi:hypothetical protein
MTGTEPMSVLPDDCPVRTWEELCLALGGSADSFTGRLLELAAKADPANRARLRAAFPLQVAMWEAWQLAREPLTVRELRTLATHFGKEITR